MVRAESPGNIARRNYMIIILYDLISYKPGMLFPTFKVNRFLAVRTQDNGLISMKLYLQLSTARLLMLTRLIRERTSMNDRKHIECLVNLKSPGILIFDTVKFNKHIVRMGEGVF